MKFLTKSLITIAFLGTLLSTNSAFADRLDDIEKRGEIKIAVFDSNPPFGFIDETTNKIVGLDIDYANAIAKELNVKVELVPTNPANRIPLLTSKKADLIVANFTVTDERAKTVDFSLPYFATGQKFIAKKGVLKTADDLKNLRIGADKGTVMEITLREKYPTAKVISYDDTPFAFAALRNGVVQAITQDDAKLIGLLANIPEEQRENFEISPFSITQEYQAVGIPKGETRLIDKVNQILLKLETNDEALTIYNRWFGPNTKSAMPRGVFKIGSAQ
ncbi:amino acid ABC transporter substrate-binding protein [Gilliamella apicola]|uniref:ABC transporter substrate-binding protein n=1 Tax=Gilliamella apicola TaxID=1196095 RepID=UPI000A33525C|nr:ABC transporter substrate-binding protein [Gilliamella apicola]OTP90605.1 amino acid ABC transporter substrate-binding protein [Gilliamella apicola]OTP94401.1 amino acid ABC transporter substrate-binding protein [Gilliamella apicola]OTP94677.1 amino acid ABC transporter substrate-binding protein [Gilliamella apicola]OTQ02345.1 amino acid ABC transporter substrate-binding protein [Gilliamella apicola]OTQ06402.1 amino acid ABC transporter substrate-binding protein [Gilliamella apicola]